MKIKSKLEKQISHLQGAAFDSCERSFKHLSMPCYYFNATTNDRVIPSEISCADCRAEDMYFDDGDSLVIDCFALMVIDFLKSCGVEVEDEV